MTNQTDNEQRIRERAHAIWERTGRPDGQEAEHWSQAEREIQEEMATGPSDVASSSREETTEDASSTTVRASKPTNPRPGSDLQTRRL